MNKLHFIDLFVKTYVRNNESYIFQSMSLSRCDQLYFVGTIFLSGIEHGFLYCNSVWNSRRKKYFVRCNSFFSSLYDRILYYAQSLDKLVVSNFNISFSK